MQGWLHGNVSLVEGWLEGNVSVAEGWLEGNLSTLKGEHAAELDATKDVAGIRERAKAHQGSTGGDVSRDGSPVEGFAARWRHHDAP
tara:strand:+ start:418 stop:678 length:261 start_codon:yes stop_codon:yes gene_type:complete